MANRIVLVSDDSDFFVYIRTKLELRKSDELFLFSFDEVLDNLHQILPAVIIINSECSKEKTIELLKIFKGNPVIVIAYNDDDAFRRKCYRQGMLDFLPLLTSDSEFRARMIPALAVAGILEKNKYYREILVKNNVMDSNNEVILDYESVLDMKLEEIKNKSSKVVFGAIAPDDKSKFLIQTNILETVILNNIRKNDILMNYAANKYFVLMFDTDVSSIEKLWAKVAEKIPHKVFAGFVNVTNQSRQQIISEVLNKLHSAINNNKDLSTFNQNPISGLDFSSGYSNFKMFRQEFAKKVEQVIAPVFYQIQQKYSSKLQGVVFEHSLGDGYGNFYIKGRYYSGCFRITTPGFSKINIDITSQSLDNNIDTKRITLEPEELEKGVLEDLLEQFLTEFREEN